MKFLSNIYNPALEDAKYKLLVPLGSNRETEWQRLLVWLEGKIITDPKATKTYSVEQLKTMSMVGVYVND